LAVLFAAVVYALLPKSLLLGPRFAVPIIELALLAALIATNPRRMVRQSRWSRIAATALAGLVIVANLTALGMLIARLVASSTSGGSLMLGAMQVWITNVIVFGLLYWELDRGGPSLDGSCPAKELPPADWRFSQDENDDAVIEVAAGSSKKSGWVPIFVDYLYVSLTNSSASTMPLTSRSTALMGLQATAALLTSLIVIARAVGSLVGGSG
jgi:hypothetical protein